MLGRLIMDFIIKNADLTLKVSRINKDNEV